MHLVVQAWSFIQDLLFIYFSLYLESLAEISCFKSGAAIEGVPHPLPKSLYFAEKVVSQNTCVKELLASSFFLNIGH